MQFCLRSGVVLNSNIWWPSDCEKWLKGKSKLKINFFQTHSPYNQKRDNGNPKEQNQIEVVSKIRYSAKRVSEAFLFLSVRGDVGGHFFQAILLWLMLPVKAFNLILLLHKLEGQLEWVTIQNFLQPCIEESIFRMAKKKKGNKQEKYTREIYCPYKLRRPPGYSHFEWRWSKLLAAEQMGLVFFLTFQI